MNNYTKLFGSILSSTIWSEPHPTRILWITMLAMSDKNGEIHATIPGLARFANITIPECEAAITKFMQPDPYSRTPDMEGRRIEKIDGGWALVNHDKYRQMASKEEQKRSHAERQKRYRHRASQTVTRDATVTHSDASVTQSRDIADTYTDTDSVKEFSNLAPPAGTRLVLEGEIQKRAPKTPKPRDPLFDALAFATDGDPRELTGQTAKACGIALAAIRKVAPELTAAEIDRRAANYRLHYPKAALTSFALSKHWALCKNPPKQPGGSDLSTDIPSDEFYRDAPF